jgi:hypothetical protein
MISTEQNDRITAVNRPFNWQITDFTDVYHPSQRVLTNAQRMGAPSSAPRHLRTQRATSKAKM